MRICMSPVEQERRLADVTYAAEAASGRIVEVQQEAEEERRRAAERLMLTEQVEGEHAYARST